MVLFAIYITLIVVGCLLRKSQPVYDILVIAFLTSVAALNTSHADYAYYNGYYVSPEGYDPTLFEPGWQFLCMLGRSAHLSYNGFAAVLALLLLCLTAWACSKLKTSRSFFWALLLIFPALLNIVQVRQFVALTIIFAAGVVFATSSKRIGVPVYVVGVLLAVLFHKTAAIMFILLGIPLLQKCSTVAKGVIVAAIAVLIGLSIVFAPVVLQPILGDRLINGYLSGTEFFNSPSVITQNRILMGVGVIILGFLLFFLCDRYLQRTSLVTDASEDEKGIWLDYMRFSKYVALIAIALAPFAFLDADILRLYRYFFIFGLGALSILAFASSKRLHRIGWKLAALVFACFAAYAFVNYGNTFNTVTASLLTYVSLPPLLVL